MKPLEITGQDDNVMRFGSELVNDMLPANSEDSIFVNYFYITKSQAIQIIEHLKQCFEL